MYPNRLILISLAVSSICTGCKFSSTTKSESKDASVNVHGYPSEDIKFIGLFDGSAQSEPPLLLRGDKERSMRAAGVMWWGEVFQKFVDRRKLPTLKSCGSVPDDPELLRPYYAFYRRTFGPPPIDFSDGSDPLAKQPDELKPDPLGKIVDAYSAGDCDTYAKTLLTTLQGWNNQRSLELPELYAVYVISKFKPLFSWSYAKIYAKGHGITVSDTLPDDIFLAKTTPSYSYNVEAAKVLSTRYSWAQLNMDTHSSYWNYFYGGIAAFHHDYPVVSGLIPVFGSVMAAGDAFITMVEGKNVAGQTVNRGWSFGVLSVNVALATLDAFMVKAAAIETLQAAKSSASQIVERLKPIQARLVKGETLTADEVAQIQKDLDQNLKVASGADRMKDVGELKGIYNGGGLYQPVYDILEVLPMGKQIRGKLISLFGGTPTKMLDAACGTGLVGQSAKEAFPGLIVDGLDQSAEMMQKAAGRKYGTLVQGDLTNIATWTDKFADGSYDVVTFNMASYFFDEATNTKILTGLTQKLKPGGRLVLSYISEGASETKFITELKNELKGIDAASTGITDQQKMNFLQANIDSANKGVFKYDEEAIRRIAGASGLVVDQTVDAYGGFARVVSLKKL